MHDAKAIVPGIALWLAIAGGPFWWSVASGARPTVPAIDAPVGVGACVEDAATMRRDHMRLLVGWRDDVVRRGDRVHVTADGRRFLKSLTGTCLRCHRDKTASCDRCHAYLAVRPSCWDCHVDRRETP